MCTDAVTPAGKFATNIAVVLVLFAASFGFLLWRSTVNANRIGDIAHDNRQAVRANRALLCAMGRLISYVPAVQFEGEPERNFLGWIDSRHDLLLEAQQRDSCSKRTRRLLEDRVARDERLLEQLTP